jgi:hypothetical protein
LIATLELVIPFTLIHSSAAGFGRKSLWRHLR